MVDRQAFWPRCYCDRWTYKLAVKLGTPQMRILIAQTSLAFGNLAAQFELDRNTALGLMF